MSMPLQEPNLLTSATVTAPSLGYPVAETLFTHISEEKQDSPASPHLPEERNRHPTAAGPLAMLALC